MTTFGANKAKRTRCLKCSVDAVKCRRKLIKQKAVEYLGGKCSNCGYNKCLDALDFHHIDPSLKSFSVARDKHTMSWEKLTTELDKCVILCANCHREIHSE